MRRPAPPQPTTGPPPPPRRPRPAEARPRCARLRRRRTRLGRGRRAEAERGLVGLLALGTLDAARLLLLLRRLGLGRARLVAETCVHSSMFGSWFWPGMSTNFGPLLGSSLGTFLGFRSEGSGQLGSL